MRHYKYIFLSISILFSMGAYAQNTAKTLSIEAAIATTIENNFTIKLNRNNAKSASIDAVPGAAGYLPTVSANASYNYASDNTDLAFADPSQPEINANGAVTETVNAGIVVDYNIYSGGSRKYTYEKLKNTSYVSELQLKQQIEQAVLTAVSQYLNALNQREAARISEESVEISRTRFDRAGSNYAFGATSKLELLNAEVDLRNDSTNYVQAMVNYKKALRDLNNAMGVAPDSIFILDDEFSYDEDLLADSIVLEALSQNTSYLLARTQMRSVELDENLTKAAFLPSLNFSGGYSYTDITYGASFLSTQTTLGWNAGLTLSYNIFDGGNRKRARQKAEIQIKNQQVSIAEIKNNLETNLLKSYDDYRSSLSLLTLLEENVETAMLNYERSQEAFNTGQLTGIELREAQLNLLNARYSVIAQRIQAKLAEVNLHFYSGTLVE